MKDIKINGHILDGALLVDDPDVKRSFYDASGQLRHVRFFSQPGKLKSYVCRHPEGIIIAGVALLLVALWIYNKPFGRTPKKQS